MRFAFEKVIVVVAVVVAVVAVADFCSYQISYRPLLISFVTINGRYALNVVAVAVTVVAVAVAAVAVVAVDVVAVAVIVVILMQTDRSKALNVSNYHNVRNGLVKWVI